MSKLKDLTGRICGFLSVQYRLPNYRQENGRTRTRWLCLCLLCGNAYIADGSHLLHGNVISCGCLKNAKAAQRMSKTKGKIKKNSRTVDLIGKTIGNNILVEKVVPSKNGKRTYQCKCLYCGNNFEARANHLVRSLIKSCGCVPSFPEKYIKKYLDNKGIRNKKEYTFDDLKGESNKPYRFDFAVLDDQNNVVCLIEYQGAHHVKNPNNKNEFGRHIREVTDDRKKEYCKAHNIPLFEIWFNQDIDEELEKIVSWILHVNSVP